MRLFGAKIGAGVHVYPTSKVWAPWNLTMLDNACLGDSVDCYSVAKIKIGRRSTISQYSFICSASHDYTEKDLPLVVAPIEIGDDVWITADVFIAPGVSIGDGVVVTARSSVFQDIGRFRVASGNPAVEIKDRVIRWG